METAHLTCRSCGHSGLEPVLSLGETPLADVLLTADQLDQPDITFPLDVGFCPPCTLLQIAEIVPPEILYCGEYPYFSSVSNALLQHFRESARSLIEARRLHHGSLVIEIASNDGYMLKAFAEQDIP